MHNPLTRFIGLKGEAQLRYLDNDYQILRPGDFVRCSVTGELIALSELRYWSVERQEAYAGPEASMKRHVQLSKRG